MYLLDTNVVSELRKPKADLRVVAWAETIRPNDLFLSVITIHELEMGILQLVRRDQAQADMLREWLENKVLPSFAERILPIELAVSRRYAALHVPDPRSYRDSFIAATALVHRLVVVTRNVKDFPDADTLNPWVGN